MSITVGIIIIIVSIIVIIIVSHIIIAIVINMYIIVVITVIAMDNVSDTDAVATGISTTDSGMLSHFGLAQRPTITTLIMHRVPGVMLMSHGV